MYDPENANKVEARYLAIRTSPSGDPNIKITWRPIQQFLDYYQAHPELEKPVLEIVSLVTLGDTPEQQISAVERIKELGFSWTMAKRTSYFFTKLGFTQLDQLDNSDLDRIISAIEIADEYAKAMAFESDQRRKISRSDEDNILDLHEIGFPQSEIAKILDVSKSTIARKVRKLKNEGRWV